MLDNAALTQAQWLPKPATSQFLNGDARSAHRGSMGEGDKSYIAMSLEVDVSIFRLRAK